MPVARDFRHGFERERIKRLHGTVMHSRDSERACFAPLSLLRDIDPAQWLGVISFVREGEFQSFPSTPGVCLPLFEVTFRTASSLASSECASNR